MPPLVTSPSTPALTPQSFPPPLSTSFQSPSKSPSSTAHPQKPPAWLHSSKLCTPIPLRHSDGILVHCFSDGGSHKAVEFAEAYFKQTGEKLPVRAQCLNSTPGVMHCQNYAHAIQQTLCHTKTASLLTRALCLLLGYIWVAAFLLFTGRKKKRNRKDA
ncbi:hypothetical protein DL95DRAFT_525511 [Leptodontidium sp. 2 PMI_412]|nr:hypothetical protein DL95DRAFT_525511 [Leptodontidium sp. 2 PMI_412]